MKGGELPFAVPVAIAFRGSVAIAVAKATEKAGEFLFEYGLDGRANVQPQTLLDRIKPGFMGQWRKAGSISNLVHGLISLAVAAAGWVGGCSRGDYAAVKFPPTPRHYHVLDPTKLALMVLSG